MESISTNKLPPIFKMSMLWNILPYYGHIHRWRRLLEKINTKTKEIWDQNREQLIYFGRDFKREIELVKSKEFNENLRPNRSWLDLFSLSLSNYIHNFKFDITILTDNLSEDEVIIIDSHDDIFKGYQIKYWRKDRISDILPAIKCRSYKSESKIFKTTEMTEMKQFIEDQNHTKSIVIDKTDEEVSINPVYGNAIKITPRTFYFNTPHTKFFDTLKERYNLWEIGDCECKPKKIRVWAWSISQLQHTIDQLKLISNINDVKFGVFIYHSCSRYLFENCKIVAFNHSFRWMGSNFFDFICTGDSLVFVLKGNSCNFRLDKRAKKSIDSYIRGRI